MNKNLSTILTVFLILVISTSTVGAAGAIKLSGTVSKGSLHFDGFIVGVGGYHDGITVKLTGFGKPVVQCINDTKYSDKRPGKNAGKIVVYDEQQISTNITTFEKGKAIVGLAIEDNDIKLPKASDGCQEYRQKYRHGWTAKLIDVIWTQVYVDIHNGGSTSGTLLRHQEYTCNQVTQTPTFISCALTLDISYR